MRSFSNLEATTLFGAFLRPIELETLGERNKKSINLELSIQHKFKLKYSEKEKNTGESNLRVSTIHLICPQ